MIVMGRPWLNSGAWAVGGAVVVAVVTAIATAAPAMAALILVGIVVLVWGLGSPKSFFAVGMIVLLLQRTVALHIDSPAVDLIDEGFAAACFALFVLRRILARQRLRGIPGLAPIAIFLVIGAISSVLNEVSFGIAGQGALLIAKAFILAFGVAQLNWTTEDLRRGAKLGACVASILIIGAAINFFAPGPWSAIVLNGQGYDDRFGVSPVTSFFQHPGYFGTVMALVCLASIAHLAVFGRTKTAFFLVAGSLVAAILTARRKVLVGLVGAVGVLALRLRWVPLIAVSILSLPVLAFLLWDTVTNVALYTYAEYFVNPEAVARVRLTTDSVGLAFSNFPVGVGFGQFGSAVARSNYSPIYYELGYPAVWGLGPTEESGLFLTDTFWPAIVGETGIIGTLCFVVVLVVIFRRFSQLRRNVVPWERWFGIVGMAWSTQLLIESVAGAVYTAAPTFALFAAIVGIAATRPLPSLPPEPKGRQAKKKALA